MLNVQIDTSRGPSGGGVCMLPVDLPGVSRGKPLEKVGVRDLLQGGKPLIDHYSIKIRIHRMFARVEAIRAMSRAIWDLNTRVYPPLPEYAFASKTFCTETAKEVVEEALQIHGANGLTKEYYVEKLWRDARSMTIADGGNSVLNRLGGHILKETFPRTTVNRIA